jgi:hypothetical protein
MQKFAQRQAKIEENKRRVVEAEQKKAEEALAMAAKRKADKEEAARLEF